MSFKDLVEGLMILWAKGHLSGEEVKMIVVKILVAFGIEVTLKKKTKE